MIDRLRAEIPELEREKAPSDGAKNYKALPIWPSERGIMREVFADAGYWIA